MNEAVNIVFGNGFGYAFCAFHMDVFKIEVSKGYQYGAFYCPSALYLVG